MPAQNATGNWVKVMQRIPVRIHINQAPARPALRAGEPHSYLFWNTVTQAGLSALNAEITRQATIVSYMDDFNSC